MKKFLQIIFILLIAGCGSNQNEVYFPHEKAKESSQTRGKAEVVVGVWLPLSGSDCKKGQALARVIELAMIHYKPLDGSEDIRVVFFDENAMAQELERFKDKPFSIVLGPTSQEALDTVSSVANSKGWPLLHFVNTDARPFRFVGYIQDQLQRLLDVCRENHGILFLIKDNQEGRDIQRFVEKYNKDNKFEVAFLMYNEDSEANISAIQSIEKKPWDYIFINDGKDTLLNLISYLAYWGVSDRKTVFLGGDRWQKIEKLQKDPHINTAFFTGLDYNGINRLKSVLPKELSLAAHDDLITACFDAMQVIFYMHKFKYPFNSELFNYITDVSGALGKLGFKDNRLTRSYDLFIINGKKINKIKDSAQ